MWLQAQEEDQSDEALQGLHLFKAWGISQVKVLQPETCSSTCLHFKEAMMQSFSLLPVFLVARWMYTCVGFVRLAQDQVDGLNPAKRSLLELSAVPAQHGGSASLGPTTGNAWLRFCRLGEKKTDKPNELSSQMLEEWRSLPLHSLCRGAAIGMMGHPTCVVGPSMLVGSQGFGEWFIFCISSSLSIDLRSCFLKRHVVMRSHG